MRMILILTKKVIMILILNKLLRIGRNKAY